METKTVYFEKPGVENTDTVLTLVKQRAGELGIRTVLVASTSGSTAVKALKALKGVRVIIVAHSTGFFEPNTQEFTEENRKTVERAGSPIIIAAHTFGGLNRACRQSDIPETPITYIVGDLIASTLKVFGQGTKVACEI
ncbi:MAG: hypothetical protein A2144_03355, partial [Chloroflexi bacterium RBG_16_50_9]